jgi:2'-5' RNA ligase
MPIPANTYVVLDVPSPFAERVLAIRERHRDPFRFSLPAETTVSGSSGTGPLAADEDLEHVTSTLDRIARETQPIETSFGPVRRFSRSDVFYLSFADEGRIRELHERIAASGLRFQATAFAFTPHCTLRTRAPVSEAEAEELLTARIEGTFVLDSLSLYDLPVAPPPTGFATLLCLLHRTRLGR